jgi:hypothetical protein
MFISGRRRKAAHAQDLEDLRQFARQRGLQLLEGEVPERILQRAALFAGRECDVELSNALIGKDVEGMYYTAHRCIGGEEHQVLVFELGSGSNIEGFTVEPLRAAEEGGRLSGVFQKGRSTATSHASTQYRMIWDVPERQQLDDATLLMAGRVLKNTVGVAKAPGGASLCVTVKDRQIAIYSTEPCEVADLDRFLDNAVSLRLDLIVALRETSSTRAVKLSQAVRNHVPAPTPRVEAERKQRVAKAMESARAVQLNHVADHIVDSALSPLDFDAPEPEPEPEPAARRRKRREIPEPGNELTVVTVYDK